MARYNTDNPVYATVGTESYSAPGVGRLTRLTGTPGYTVTLTTPSLCVGQAQTFYNATTGNVTLFTPSGVIQGPGFTDSSSQTIPTVSAYTVTSDGTNYVVTNNEGGPAVGTAATFTGDVYISSTSAATTYNTGGALRVAGGLGVTGAVYINSTLNCNNDITAWYSSDENLKENIVPIESALNKIDAIGGYTFTWNAKAKTLYPDRGEDVGVIAQEVQKVQPHTVTKRDNGYLAVNYEKLVPLLIQGIKELRAEVNTLKAKLGE
jgi:hypothetical protein